MITIEADEQAIHVTIPRGELDVAEVEALLRPFRFSNLVAGSQMTREQAEQLAEESKADWWEKNQHRFLPEQR